jgi:predicted nucleic acid-binding protein
VSVFVVDASLVIKWFVPEVDSAAARRWLDAPHDYIAPDLLFPEGGHTVWKKVRRGRFARRLAAHPLLAPHVHSLKDFISE